MTSTEAQQLMISDMIHNKSYYLDLIKDVTPQLEWLLKDEDPVFHNDIEKNYLDVCKSKIILNVTWRLQINAEDAMVVLSAIDLKEYLK